MQYDPGGVDYWPQSGGRIAFELIDDLLSQLFYRRHFFGTSGVRQPPP
jgi:hypothetical protein